MDTTLAARPIPSLCLKSTISFSDTSRIDSIPLYATKILLFRTKSYFCAASPEERARRRWRDRQQQGHTAAFADILADVERRDAIDSNREHSPLRPAADALIIDTTGHAVAEIVRDILEKLAVVS